MKPILFNTEMVRAILDGRKTATRRVVKPTPPKNARLELVGDRRHAMDLSIEIPGPNDHRIYTPPYLPGDILYVRETWSKRKSNECYGQPCHGGVCPYESCEQSEGPCFPDEYVYKASGDSPGILERWHPSIHMPKDAARIFLRVTDVHVERLQQIMDDPPGPNNQIVREGCKYGCDFIALWDRTIKPADKEVYGWEANPFVWVIEFERCEKPKEEKI